MLQTSVPDQPSAPVYNARMDSVRFGRVLGTGARLAARTLANAVDAATAPNPRSPSVPEATPTSTAPTAQESRTDVQSNRNPAQTAARAASNVLKTGSRLGHGSKQFAQTAFGPVKKLSGVLWLEFTGFFFGLFAVTAGLGAWKLRADLHSTGANVDGHLHFLLAAGMSVVFAYFCLTSFLTARRRSRL